MVGVDTGWVAAVYYCVHVLLMATQKWESIIVAGFNRQSEYECEEESEYVIPSLILFNFPSKIKENKFMINVPCK